MSPLQESTLQQARLTSLTIDNLLIRDVGLVLEVLREAGFQVELNLGTPQEDER